MTNIYQQTASFLINEVEPRKKLKGYYPPAAFVALLIILKQHSSHQQIRQILVKYYDPSYLHKIS